METTTEAIRLLATLYQRRTAELGVITLAALPSRANKKKADEAADQGVRMEGLQYYASHQTVENTGPVFTGFLAKNAGVRGLYFRQGRMRRGAAGKTRDEVVEVCHAWVDIDERDPERKEHALRRLLDSARPPTVVVDSGGGLQAHWVLDQPVQDARGFAQVETLNRELARIYDGDPAVVGVQSCMRLAGTPNLNYDPPRRAEILYCAPKGERLYPLEQLLDWAMVEGRPPVAADDLPGRIAELQRISAALGFKRPISPEEWAGYVEDLATEGKRNLAATKLAGKLLSQDNVTVEGAVQWLLERGCTLPATEVLDIVVRVAEKDMRRNPERVIYATNAELAAALRAERAETMAEVRDELRTNDAAPLPAELEPAPPADPSADDPVGEILDAVRQAQTEKKSVTKLVPNALGVAKRAIDKVFRLRGERLLHTEEQFWHFSEARGFWRPYDAVTLEQVIQTFFEEGVGWTPTKAFASEIVRAVRAHVHQPEVPWGGDGRVFVAKNRVAIDIATGREVTVTPEMYLRQENVLAVDWVPGATCPTWDAAVEKIFSHIDPADRPGVVRLIEEWLGTMLLRRKPRNLAKALVLHGNRRTGKSTLLEAGRILVGEVNASAAGISELEGTFAGMALLGKMAWLTDEMPTGGRLADDLLKKLVTNEPVSINVKHKPAWFGRLGLTIGFATNQLPRIDDTSDAVWDRMLFVGCDTVIDPKTDDPGLIEKLHAEGAGLLQRVYARLRDLLARGDFEVPELLRLQQDQLQAEENPMGAFLKAAFRPGPKYVGAFNADIADAYVGFLRLQLGDQTARTARVNMRAMGKRITEMFGATSEQAKGGAARVRLGIEWTPAGLAWLDAGWKLRDDAYESNEAKLKAARWVKELAVVA